MLKIENLAFNYDQTPIIKDLNVHFVDGHITAILGASGSGKSTLLRIIAGLLSPTQGRILLHGKDITKEPPEKRKIGMVFQDYALFPHMSIAKNIAFSLKNKRDPIIDELLDITEMKAHKDKYPHELSGGERQRIALARTLAYKPRLLLLDEPFSNLDANLKENVRVKVKSILDHYQLTTILVTHDEVDANVLSDIKLNMAAGQLV